MPKTGPVQYPLEVQPGSYKICITRKGYQRLDFPRMSREGEQLPPYPVRWIPTFDSWGQDLDEAKQLSAGGKKDILIVFDRSDRPPKSAARLMQEIFSKAEFLKLAADDFVLLYVNFAETPEARLKVKDPARNEALGQRFQVTDFPTVVLVGKQFRPVGILPANQDCDLKGFLDLLKEWRETDDQLRTLTKDIATATDKTKKNDAICKAWDLVVSNDLERYYGREIEQWKGMLPADLAATSPRPPPPRSSAWMARLEPFTGLNMGGEAALEAVAEFDKWRAGRSFADHNAAARLCWAAAVALFESGQAAKAAKMCEEGLKFNPSDEQVRTKLEVIRQIIADARRAQRGCPTTNRQVVHYQKKLKVPMLGQDTPMAAELLAEDVKVGIAMDKLQPPVARVQCYE